MRWNAANELSGWRRVGGRKVVGIGSPQIMPAKGVVVFQQLLLQLSQEHRLGAYTSVICLNHSVQQKLVIPQPFCARMMTYLMEALHNRQHNNTNPTATPLWACVR